MMYKSKLNWPEQNIVLISIIGSIGTGQSWTISKFPLIKHPSDLTESQLTFKKVKIFAPNLNFVAKIHEFDDSQFCKEVNTI